MDESGTPEDRDQERAEGRPRRGRWGRWLMRAGLAVVALLLLAGLALTSTGPGKRALLEVGLDQVRGALAGELTVEEIRGASLLGGTTLAGVGLTTDDGRPFLTVDSLHARWSLPALVLGRPALASLTLWGPRVEISRYTEDQAMTVERLLAPSEPRPDSVAGTPTRIRLGRVRVEGGLVEVLTPAEPGDTTATVPSPTGEGRLSRLALEGLSLELDRALLTLGGREPFSAFLVRLESDVSFADRPIRITGAEGNLRFGTRGLTVQDGYFRFPGTVMAGDLELGPQVTEGGGWAFGADLATERPGALADLRWIDPRIPDGYFSGRAAVTVGERVEVSLEEAVVDLEASDLSLDGGLTLDEGISFRDFRVEAQPLVLERLEPWLGRELPLDGFLTGNLTFQGPLTALRTDGRVSLAPEALEGGPTTADVGGTLHLGERPGATNLEIRLAPLNFALAEAMAPGRVPHGTGSGTVTVSGRLSESLRVVADVTHGSDSLASRIVARGTLRRSASEPLSMDILTDLTPFSLGLVADLAPRARLHGSVSGSVRTVGRLDSLRVLGSLEMAGGEVELDGGINLLAPDSLYRLDARLREVALAQVSGALPEPSTWTGRVQVQGSGFTPDSLEAEVGLVAGSSRVGGLQVDSVEASLRAGAGLLTVDTVTAELAGVRLWGGGSMGLTGQREGRAELTVQAESLARLRPLLRGDTVIAGDTLTVMERELLRFEGIDPDTLPDIAEVAMDGALEARVSLWGWVESLGVEGVVTLTGGVYGMNRVDSLGATFRAEGLPSMAGTATVELDALGLDLGERSFQQLHGILSMEDRAGEATVEVQRGPGELLAAEGEFALDSLGGGEVGLARARLEFDSLAYETAGPSIIAWDSTSVRFQGVEVLRGGDEPMRLTAEGTLAWRGESDLALEVQGLRLGRLTRIARMEGLEVAGAVDMELTVNGPSSDPAIDGRVRWIQPRYNAVALDSIAGSLRYRERNAEVDLSAWSRDRLTFTTRGVVPVDLALDSVADRTVARPLDLKVEADSLAAANVLSFLEFLEGVEGWVSGEFDVRGTLDQPQPEGVFRLADAAWTMEALGVRHQGINGTLTLSPDRTVAVELSTRAAGTSTITGTVSLDPLTDPTLDLDIEFDGFQAVARSDIEGRISGSLDLTGRYRQPLVQGQLQVDQGTLFLEEFARASEVVDLSDPRILEVVDTTALSTRPILAGVRNPFLQKLRVDIDLSVPRDTWLRSSDMNVEMGGSLLVTYDRTNRDLVMVGELQALRGSYTILGRTFQVEGGTVGFIGTPGINPTLDIEALARVRQLEGEAINVTATVEGNLTQPRVQLSSDEAGLGESDLVSYLIFGRPSYELASQSAALNAAASVPVTWATGTLANRLGSALAREVGVDYVNITRAGNYAAASGILSGTQIEVGQYLSENVFVVLVFRPPTEQGNQGVFGGARVEWSLSGPYTVEGFIEERSLRSGVSGFRDLGLESSQIVGVFIFREWGY